MRRTVLCVLIVASGMPCAAQAADLTISTDRPGILYGTAIAPAGYLQLEAGLPTWQRSDFGNERNTLLTTPMFLRVGISDSLELQIADSPFNRATARSGAGESSSTGAGDLQLGAKYLLRSGGTNGPTLVLVGYVSVPTGSAAFTAGRPGYNLNLVGDWPLDANTGVGAMVSYTRMPAPNGSHADSGIAAMNLSHNFNERLGGYVEAGWFPGFRNVQATALAGGGLTWLVTHRFQIDGFFDRGLNRASPDWVLGTGVSVLF